MKNLKSPPTEDYLKRKRIRTRFTIALIFLSLIIMTALQVFIQKTGIETPIANNIAVLLLFNVNVLLLLVLVLLVSRNLVRLYLERKANVVGSRFQTKLVLSYVVLTLVPSVLLFLVASGLLTNAIDKWFDVQVETSLKESLDVAESYYKGSEENVLFYTTILSELISGQRMLETDNSQYLINTIKKKQTEYSLDSIVVYGIDGEMISETLTPSLKDFFIKGDLGIIIEKAMEGNPSTRIIPYNNQNLIIAVSPVLDYWDGSIKGATLASKFISHSMVEKINNIGRSYKDYKQLKVLKDPLKISYEITLLLIALLVIFAAIWVGFSMARGISVPIKELVEATHIIAGGNLDYQIKVQAKDEIKMLVESFNRMIFDLKSSKQEIDAGNEELHRKNIELDRHSKYMETILENIAAGVISVDRQGRVSTINRSATEILGLYPDEVRGIPYRGVFDAAYLDPVRSIIKNMNDMGKENLKRQIQVTVSGRSMTLMVNVTVLRKTGGEYLGMVIVFDDLTELIKAQKTAAWQEVAQGIAHEIKNPLTPIKLNTQRLRKKFKEKAPDFDVVFDEGTEVIIKEVEGLRKLVDEFSQFARMPEANPKPENIHEIIEEVVALYKDNRKKVTLKGFYDSNITHLNVDREQVKRVFINLVENALDAINNGNGVIEIKTSLDKERGVVSIQIYDNGTGIRKKDWGKLFLPYFTTKKRGSGLGLAIVNRIIMDHDGHIRIEDNKPKGSKFVIELPAGG